MRRIYPRWYDPHNTDVKLLSLTLQLGKRIITACAGGDLIYWDPRSDTPIFKRQNSEGKFSVGEVTSIAINPSSTIVVVGGSNGLTRIISLVKGDVVATLTGHSEEDSVESMAFVDLSGTSNGPLVLITGGTDGKACIWDSNTWRLRGTLKHDVSHLSTAHILCSDFCHSRKR